MKKQNFTIILFRYYDPKVGRFFTKDPRELLDGLILGDGVIKLIYNLIEKM